MRKTIMALTLAAALTGTACGGARNQADSSDPAEAATPTESEFEVTTTDFAFDTGGVESIPAGTVWVTIDNEGEQPHQAQLYRLADGASFDDFIEMANEHGSGSELPSQALELLSSSQALAPGITGAGNEERLKAEVEAGTYAVVCNVPDPETGKPHYQLGMITRLEVT